MDESGLSRTSFLSASNMSLASSKMAGGWVVLDVAGKEFRTTRSSLRREQGSIFSRIAEDEFDQLCDETDGRISFDESTGKWMIDADQDYFPFILNYLRNGKLTANIVPPQTHEELMDLAEFFRLPILVSLCKQRMLGSSFAQNQGIQQFGQQPPPGFFGTTHLVGVGSGNGGRGGMPPPPGFENFSSQKSKPPDFLPKLQEESAGQMFAAPQDFDSNILLNLSQLTSGSSPTPAASVGNKSNEQIGLIKMEEDEDDIGIELMEEAPETEQRQKRRSQHDREFGRRTAGGSNTTEDSWCTSPDQFPDSGPVEQGLNGSRQEQGNNYEVDPDFGTRCGADNSNDLLNGLISNCFNIGSTIFEPPAQTIVNVNQTTDRVPAYQFADVGTYKLMPNFDKVFERRQRSLEKYIDALKLAQEPEAICHDRFGSSIGAVLYILQRLHVRYPGGCTAQQYIRFEEELKENKSVQPKQVLFANMLPTVVSLLEGDLLYVGESGKLLVQEEVVRTHLFCLRKNFCSNLYRFLLSRPQWKAQVGELLCEMERMLPKGVGSPGPECLLSICNRHPAIFQLRCSSEDDYRFDMGWVSLCSSVVGASSLRWRVVLDCEVTNMGLSFGTAFCDCGGEKCGSCWTAPPC